MADRSSLSYVGALFAALTMAVLINTVLVVKDSADEASVETRVSAAPADVETTGSVRP